MNISVAKHQKNSSFFSKIVGMWRWFWALTAYFGFMTTCIAQDLPAASSEENKDSRYLINDLVVQNQVTDAINAMYNFKFEEAENGFRWLKYRHPQHPLGNFLLGLCQWWRIMPNSEDSQHDDKFLALMDSSIVQAKDIYDKDEQNYEATFFLAAAYGFKGRLHAERRHWTKATVAARNSLEYLKKSKKSNDFSPEFLFGDALYNYYAMWIPENYKFLKPILAMFPKGNKDLGIQQLENVTRNAFYTRTEAQYFLMRIYANEENNPIKAFPMAEYLAKTFPDNAYFERNYARMCYQMGRTGETELVSVRILDKIQRNMVGYEGTSGRYAAFYLGYINYHSYNNKVKAKDYFQKAVEFAKQTNAATSGYNLYALLYLFRIAKEENRKEDAIAICEQITELAEKKHDTYKEAKEYLKANKKKRFLFW